jgi:hypothetical protein
MDYFDLWFSGGENDRYHIHCKYEINDAESVPRSILDDEEECISIKSSKTPVRWRYSVWNGWHRLTGYRSNFSHSMVMPIRFGDGQYG